MAAAEKIKHLGISVTIITHKNGRIRRRPTNL